MKQKIKQILYEIRRQPLISGVTFVATVLSVFLIMIVVIIQRVSVVPFSPESCRDRMLVGQYIHMRTEGGEWSGGASLMLSRKLYEGLDGVEHVSYIERFLNPLLVKGSTENSFTAESRKVDADFFKIFDHPLISGRYFTSDEYEAHLPVAVISESTARKAFGTVDCENMTILIDHRKFTVTGVVKDNSRLATTASGDIFVPHDAPAPQSSENNKLNDYFGPISAVLLVKEGVDFQSIRDQVKSRYAIIDTEVKPLGCSTVYHESPYDQETLSTGMHGSNATPDASGARKSRYFIYAILLIVPAINLSSLLHSRMRRRVAEIGVRRAYGCTRLRVIADIIWENFLITLAGGIVGVALGVIFAMTYSGLYEDMDTYGSNLTPALSAVINWSTITIALCVCFILNLISASVPAWQASRINPVEAINAK